MTAIVMVPYSAVAMSWTVWVFMAGIVLLSLVGAISSAKGRRMVFAAMGAVTAALVMDIIIVIDCNDPFYWLTCQLLKLW